jgi:hypothetical protein
MDRFKYPRNARYLAYINVIHMNISPLVLQLVSCGFSSSACLKLAVF